MALWTAELSWTPCPCLAQTVAEGVLELASMQCELTSSDIQARESHGPHPLFCGAVGIDETEFHVRGRKEIATSRCLLDTKCSSFFAMLLLFLSSPAIHVTQPITTPRSTCNQEDLTWPPRSWQIKRISNQCKFDGAGGKGVGSTKVPIIYHSSNMAIN